MAWTLDAVNPVIFQTGTETSLAGLAAISGVTTSLRGAKIIYNTGGRRLVINGQLSFNSNDEMVHWDVGSPVPELIINGGNALTISGERTVGTLTFFTQEIGLSFERTGATTFAPADSWVTNNGLFTLNGAGVNANSVIAMGGKFVANDALLQNRTLGANFRYQSGTHEINGLRMENLNTTLINTAPAQLNGLAMVNGAFTFVTLPGNTPGNPRLFAEQGVTGGPPTFTNFGTTDNYVEFKNYQDWDGLVMGMNGNVNFSFRFTKDIDISYRSLAGPVIEGAVAYIPDNDNGNRPSFYPNDEPLIAVTGAQGTTSGKRLALIASITTNTGPNADKIPPNLDLRNPGNDDSGDDTVFLFAYGFVPLRVPINLKGNNVLNLPVTGTADVNVTLSESDARAKLASSFTVDTTTNTVTVTANSTYDDIYDALVAFKATDTEANLKAPSVTDLSNYIVTPNGTQLTGFNGWTLVVNNGVTLDEGDKFKFVQFTNITNNGLITGVYGSNAGVSKILEVAGVTAGASVYVGNDSTGITTLFVDDADQESYRVYFEPGSTPAQLVARELYGFQRFEQVVTLQDGLNVISLVDIEDVGIDEPDLSTVLAYTDINTGSKFYDRTAAFRLTEQGIKKGQIATRSGFAIELDAGVGVLVNQNASLVYSVSSGLITIKALSFEDDARYNTIIAVPPATVEADTNEVISIAVEDANGDSSVDILGGDGTFELYKVTEATPTADFAQGELLDTVSNGRYRFISAPGFDIVGVDINSNIRRRSSMSKGIYEQAFFVGEQIQLAQAPQVIENSVKLDILAVELASIKGVGYDTNKQSLVKLRQHVTNASQF